jgi:Flp pilus assembly protein TadD
VPDRAGQVEEAHTTLKQARAANPNSVRTLYVLGWAAQQVGNIEESREAYQSFIALAPSLFAEQKATAARRLQELR